MGVRVDEAGVRLFGGVFLFVIFLSFASGRVGGAGGGLLGAPFVPKSFEFFHLGGLIGQRKKMTGRCLLVLLLHPRGGAAEVEGGTACFLGNRFWS